VASIGVLLVEDYEPFRRFLRSVLEKRPELRIVGEASDGLEAIQKVEELHPDLTLLDVGLPTLNGLEVARRIRKLSPESKILFVSQETSDDVVQEALRVGALGYVVKAFAGSELLAAVEAVRLGRRFLSAGLADHRHVGTVAQAPGRCFPGALRRPMPGKAQITRSHDAEFYSDDAAFVVGFAQFVEAALEAGKAAIVVATGSHRKSLLERLQQHGVDIIAAIEQGRYVSVDVGDTLSAFMVNDLPDPARFFRVADDLIAPAAQTVFGGRVVMCGESASILWADGKVDAAIQLERFCNQLAKRYGMDILCGFSLSSSYHEQDQKIFAEICRDC
jgi:CheY-like chemotaxis protein